MLRSFYASYSESELNSSYVVTDPKGSIVIECGNALGCSVL